MTVQPAEKNRGDVLGALLYLRVTSLKNIVKSRLMRLRQPKYLFGGIAGMAYIYFAFYRRVQMNRNFSSAGFSVEQLEMAATIGAAVLLLIFALCWIWPRERAALNFTETEIAFLFPAPVSRPALINFRLVSSQIRLLFTALIITLVSGGLSFLPGSAVIRIVGWWVVFATLSLHLIGSSFVITRLLDRGVTSLRRQLMIAGIIVVVVAVTVAWIWREAHAPSAEDLVDFSAFSAYLSTLLTSGPLFWLLLPVKALVKPLFATDTHSLLVALGPALLVYTAHYLWVLRVEVAFEEASIAKAEKRAAKIAALRAGKWRMGNATAKARRAPFDLTKAKRPELAFLWKNLLSTAEYLRPRTALIAATVIVAGCTWLKSHSEYHAVLATIDTFVVVISAYLLVLGPQIARQDLRSDLLNADILKTYPLRGWQIVLGEILTPVAIVTVLIWLAILSLALTFEPRHMEWLTPQVRVYIAIGLALAAPLLCTLQLLIVNTAAVLFPAWLQTSNNRGSPGIDVMGQRIFFLAGQFFVIVVALIPAAIAASAIYFSLQWTIGVPIAIVFSAATVLAVLSAEIILGIRWLGTRFERFDLSAELRP